MIVVHNCPDNGGIDCNNQRLHLQGLFNEQEATIHAKEELIVESRRLCLEAARLIQHQKIQIQKLYDSNTRLQNEAIGIVEVHAQIKQELAELREALGMEPVEEIKPACLFCFAPIMTLAAGCNNCGANFLSEKRPADMAFVMRANGSFDFVPLRRKTK